MKAQNLWTLKDPGLDSPRSSSVPGRYWSTRLSEVLSAVSTPLLTSRTTRLSRMVPILPLTTARVLSIPPSTAPRVLSTAVLSLSETLSLALDTASLALDTI